MSGAATAGQGAGYGPLAAAGLLAVSLLVLQLPALPPLWVAVLAMAIGACGLLAPSRLLRGFGFALLAAGWTAGAAHSALSERIATAALPPAVNLVVEVDGLPRSSELATRFAARVLEAPGELYYLQGRRLQVSWFGSPPPAVEPGERWRLSLRLRPPHGLRNPGGFDFERHALQQRIAALATVAREGGERVEPGRGVDLLRERIAQRIEASGAPVPALLRGLAVGDTRALEDADWDRLRHTGLSHLLAISGLHVGLVAGLFALLARGLYWLAPSLGLRLPLPQAAALAALLGATGYAVLAGLSLPTVRTLIMLGVALSGVLLRRRLAPGQALALAALALWAMDPLALLGPGFWLSLGGVFWLLACVPRGEGWRAAAGGLLRAQLVLGLALAPLSVLFFGGVSLAGILLNLVAVPWVTLMVVPVLLLAVLSLGWAPLSAFLLDLAGAAMQALWWLAGWAAGHSAAYLHLAAPEWPALLLALLAVLWLLAPRGVPARALALLLLLPLAVPARPVLTPGAFRVDVLDVGQGLSLLVRTAGHALLYDAGDRSRGGFDMGDAVVVPALRALGVSRLDTVMASHGDRDHAGGVGAVQAAFRTAVLIGGEPSRTGGQRCEAPTAWDWDGVRFELLHPPVHFPELGNEASCVLRVVGAGGAALIPGDIGEVIELRLLRERPEALSAELLVVPHHGSRSSSHPRFVEAVDARWAVIAAGAGNRFGHPHPEVVERYRAQGAETLESAREGRLGWWFAADGVRLVHRERMDRRRFWQVVHD